MAGYTCEMKVNMYVVWCLISVLIAVLPCRAESFARGKSADLSVMAGEMIMTGFRGQALEHDNAPPLRALREGKIGGVILFAKDIQTGKTRNISSPEQLKALTARLAEAGSAGPCAPVWIAVDQEGGRVRRLSAHNGFRDWPSALNMGRRSPQHTWETALDMGLMLADMGINLNFAPSLDLHWPDSPAIGRQERAFSSEPAGVARHGAAFARGMRNARIVCCYKHFPGHGYATADSHVELPVDDRPLTDIRTNDEVPYASMGTLLTSVMPAHVTYPQVSPAPAGFSKKWLQEELRGRLGYNGLIFSDDLSMKGASEVGEITARSDAALAAGCDMILICNDPESAKTVLENQRWIRTKAFDERVARIQPRGKFPSWDGLKLSQNYLACVKQIEAFNAEIAEKADKTATL